MYEQYFMIYAYTLINHNNTKYLCLRQNTYYMVHINTHGEKPAINKFNSTVHHVCLQNSPDLPKNCKHIIVGHIRMQLSWGHVTSTGLVG